VEVRSASRIAFTVAEYAQMLGRTPDAVRRELERRARRGTEAILAVLPLGVRAERPLEGGRWSIVVPRALLSASPFPPATSGVCSPRRT
jgi:hypothetical protein